MFFEYIERRSEYCRYMPRNECVVVRFHRNAFLTMFFLARLQVPFYVQRARVESLLALSIHSPFSFSPSLSLLPNMRSPQTNLRGYRQIRSDDHDDNNMMITEIIKRVIIFPLLEWRPASWPMVP